MSFVVSSPLVRSSYAHRVPAPVNPVANLVKGRGLIVVALGYVGTVPAVAGDAGQGSRHRRSAPAWRETAQMQFRHVRKSSKSAASREAISWCTPGSTLGEAPEIQAEAR